MRARVLLAAAALAVLAAPAVAEAWLVPAGERRVVEDADLVVPHGLVVEGELVLRRARLVFAQDPDAPGALVVRDGGRLEATNATITTAADRLAAFPWLNLTVQRASAIFTDSVLQFPTTPAGDRRWTVWLEDADVDFVRSELRAHPRESISGVRGPAGYLAADEADDAPLLVVDGGDVRFVESTMGRPYEVARFEWTRVYPAAKGSGDDTGTDLAVFLRGDHAYRLPPGRTLHVRGFGAADGAATAMLALTYVTHAPYAALSAVEVSTGDGWTRVAAVTPTAGQNEARVDLASAGVPLDALGDLEVRVRNDGAGDVLFQVLRVESSQRPRETGPVVRDGGRFLAVDARLALDWRDPLAEPGLANHLHVEDGGRAYLLNVTLADAETSGVRAAPAVEVRGEASEAAVFRRLDVRAVDADGAPVAGAEVRIGRAGFDASGDDDAWRLNAELARARGGEEARTRTTGADGRAGFELVSDLLREKDAPNSAYVGQYVVEVDRDGAAVERPVSLPLYPRTGGADAAVAVEVAVADPQEAVGGPRLAPLQAVVAADGRGVLVLGRVPRAGPSAPPPGTLATVEVVPLDGTSRPLRASAPIAEDGTFAARFDLDSDGRYGVVARAGEAVSPPTTLQITAPGPVARWWGSVPAPLSWALLAAGAAALVVQARRARRERAAAEAPPAGPAFVCGHCGDACAADDLGCARCGALFDVERRYCGACGAALGGAACAACGAAAA